MLKARRHILMSAGGSGLGGKGLATGTDRHFTRVHRRATDVWEVRCSCNWSASAESAYDATGQGKWHAEQVRRISKDAKVKKPAESTAAVRTSKKVVQGAAPEPEEVERANRVKPRASESHRRVVD